MKTKIKKLNQEIKKIEIENAWESSWTRKMLSMLFIYLAIGIYLTIIEFESPWLNAFVPVTAFIISTFSLPFVKKIWMSEANIR